MEDYWQTTEVLCALIDVGVYLGIPADELLRDADIDPDILGSEKAAVKSSELHAVFRRIYATAQDPEFPVRFAPLIMSGTRDLVREMMRSANTLGESLIDFVEYQELLFPEFSMRLELGETESTFFIPFRELHDPVHEIAYCLTVYAAMFTHCKYLSGGRWQLTGFYSEFDTWQPLSVYEAFYQCPLHFEQNNTRITFKTDLLNLPLAGKHLDEYRSRVEKQASDQLIALRTARNTIRHAAEFIELRLEDPAINNQAVAEHLKLNVRTLQRSLKLGNSSVAKIREGLRRTKAMQLVNEAELSFSDISDNLGFSNTASFYKAFKRWTGQTPGEYRNSKSNL